MRFLKILFFIQLVLMLTVSGVIAQDYYVNVHSGSDDNTGDTWKTAYMTVSKASQVVQSGDNIYIMPGRYYETLYPLRHGADENNRISYIGIKKGVVIHGETIRQCAYNNYNYITFKNLEFTKTVSNVVSAVYNSGAYFNLIDCRIIDNYVNYSAAYTAAGFRNSGNNVVIKNCVFAFNHISRSDYGGSAGGFTTTNRIDLIENCLFYGNTCNADPRGAPGGYILAYKFYNNIIAKNYYTGGDLSSNPSAVSGAKLHIYAEHGYNCIFGNYNAPNEIYENIPGKNNIYADPLFYDEDNRIFQLQAGSPCVKAGYPVNNRFANIGPYGIGIYFDTETITAPGSNWTLTDVILKDGKLFLNDTDNDKKGTVLSPEIPLGNGNSRLNRITYMSEEWEILERGFKQVIDNDADLPRGIEINGKVGGSYEGWKVLNETDVNKNYEAVKLRLILRKDAN